MQLARILTALFDLLFPPADTARLLRDCTDEAFLSLLAPIVTKENIIALFPYRHPLVRAIIVEAKFHRNEKALRLLAMALTEYSEALREDMLFTEGAPTFVSIPLGKKRFKERGYNQVELILARSGLRNTPILSRTKETRPQTSLSRTARNKNMEGAFITKGTVDPHVSYIVIDDVTTTGSTLRAAKTALSRQGAAHVILLALAH